MRGAVQTPLTTPTQVARAWRKEDRSQCELGTDGDRAEVLFGSIERVFCFKARDRQDEFSCSGVTDRAAAFLKSSALSVLFALYFTVQPTPLFAFKTNGMNGPVTG
jgi:hypothetical protein